MNVIHNQTQKNTRKIIPMLAFILPLFSFVTQADVSENFEDGNFDGWSTTGNVTINSLKSIDNYSMRFKGRRNSRNKF